MPKPLVESEEVKQMAKEAVLKQVDKEIKELTDNQTQTEQILQLLTEIKQSIEQTSTENKQHNMLRMEVLRKLKAKLETS